VAFEITHNTMAGAVDSPANDSGGFVTKGFPVEILDCQVDSKLLCTLCKLLPRNPVQGFCGHRFCNSCIVDRLARFAYVIYIKCSFKNLLTVSCSWKLIAKWMLQSYFEM